MTTADPIFIYTLTCGNDVYVGQTKRPEKRRREHAWNGRGDDWVWSIVASVTADNANAVECSTMDRMAAAGFNVVSSKGGSSAGASWSDPRRVENGKRAGSQKKIITDVGIASRKMAGKLGGKATSAIQVQCLTCRRVSTPGGMSRHQHWTGHTGQQRVSVSDERSTTRVDTRTEERR